MSDVTLTPNMQLPVPNLTDPGPDYANNVNTSLDIIDAHDHDGVDGGVLLDLSIQNVLSDLSLSSNNLTNVRSVELNDNPSQLTGSQDVNCLYVLNNNLGFNNSNGVFVPITSGTSLAITALSLTNFASRNITSSATILSTDTYNLINVNSSAGAVVITLPVASIITPTAANRLFIIRDIGEDAGTNNITIQVAGGSGNIFADSGASSFVLNTSGGYVGIYTDGISNWYTFTQNTYNEQIISLNNSVLDAVAGSNININSSAINVNIGSAINLVSATESLDSTSTLTTNGTTSFNSGSTTTFQSGSDLQIEGKLEGLTSSGTLFIAGTNSIRAGAANAIMPIVAGGISDGGVTNGIKATILGGIDSTVLGGIQSTVNGGIQNAGGSGDWVSFSDVGGRSESRLYPLICNSNYTVINTSSGGEVRGILYTPATWTSGIATSPAVDSTIWFSAISTGEGSNANFTYNTFSLPQLHNGATLTSVDAVFYVSSVTSVSGIAGTAWSNYFNIQVYRVDMSTGAQGSPFPYANRQTLSSVRPIQSPYANGSGYYYPGAPIITPSSGSAWFNGGNIQYMTYYCDGTNTVIQNGRYLYYVAILDLLGSASGAGFNVFQNFCGIRLNYTNITDMRFI